MAYKVLYRKYRPSNFDEVADQKAIVQTLSNALKKKKIAHAYLFCGPRGTGKTTMAKILAKAINCERDDGTICNTCDNCISANKGIHPDIVEIDAASNNGVEEVRNLLEKVKFTPIKGKYKVYIIDEVHMMTQQAFNALLKTLEEPPQHVIFILATTEPQKVLPTIQSRCQRYNFAKINENAMRDYLMEILDKEGVIYDKEALTPIVKLADGGMRDALMMLDEVLSYTENKISEKEVLSLFGVASNEEKIALLNDVANKEVGSILRRIEEFLSIGVDIYRLCLSLLDILKEILIYQITFDDDLLTNIDENNAIKFANFFTKDEINEMINILLEASNNFKSVSNPKSLFEITLLKLANIKNSTIESKKIEVINENKPIEKENIDIVIEEEIKLDSDGEKKYIDDDTILKLMVSASKDERVELSKKWSNSISPFKLDNKIGAVAKILLDGKPYILTKNVFIIRYDSEYLAKKVNIKSNQDKITKLTNALIKRNLYIYAIGPSDDIRLKKLFAEKKALGQLPKKDEDITIKED